MTLVNQSDVEAFFSVCLDRVEDSVFSVEPAEGIIAPTSKVKLTVKVAIFSEAVSIFGGDSFLCGEILRFLARSVFFLPQAHCDESTRFVDALVVSIRNGAEKCELLLSFLSSTLVAIPCV